MEEAAGEQKKKNVFRFPIVSCEAVSRSLHCRLSRLPGILSRASEGMGRKKQLADGRRQAPFKERESMASFFFLQALTTNLNLLLSLIHFKTDAAAAAAKAEAAQLLRRYVLDALRASGRADAEAYSQ